MPDNAPGNCCPKCLLELALEETQSGQGEVGTDTIPSASIKAKAKTEIMVRKDDQPLARYVFGPGDYLIGRDADCQVRVDSADVSKRHARLSIQEDHLWLEDLGSSNGSFLNGQRLAAPVRLRPPESVMVGGVILEISRPAEDEQLRPERRPVAELSPEAPEQAVKRPRNYQVEELIGRGGMGAVHHAEDLNIRRAVAMKVLRSGKGASRESVLRFLQEARVLGQLEHPNIVPIHELGLDEDGQVFYTMKFVKGRTLGDVLSEIKAGSADTIAKYPLATWLTVFQKVCDAMSFAHSKGVIHRDLKPANIMLGDFGEVLVMDWGLAKILATEDETESQPCLPAEPRSTEERSALQTVEGRVMGTPDFMAPEQAEGRIADIDARTDVYALGGILYNILTLRPPVSGTNVTELLQRIRRGDIRPPTDFNEIASEVGRDKAGLPTVRVGVPHCPGGKLPSALSAVAMKALDVRSKDRYQSVAELQKDIDAYQSGFVTSAERASPLRLAKLWIKRHRVAFAVLAGVAMLGAVFAAILLMMWLELRGTANTFYEKSQALLEAGKFSEALTPINYAIRLEGGKAEYYCLRGNLLESLLDLDGAQQSYGAALKLKPDYKLAEENLHLCQQLLRAASGHRPLPISSLSALYETILRQSRSEEAQAIARQLLDRDDAPRKELYARWRAKLDQAGIGGMLQVGKRGPRTVDERTMREIWDDSRMEKAAERTGMLWSVAFPPAENVGALDDKLRVELNLRFLPVSDLSALKGIPLNALDLYGTRVTDLWPLAGMPLDWLSLKSTKVSDLAPLKGMRLRRLDLDYSNVRDLTPLAGMPLEEIWLDHVKDIRPLAGMPLRGLFGLQVNDMPTLRTLELEKLSPAGEWNVSDLPHLRELPKLRWLWFAGCKGLKDISPLRGMPLTHLQIDPAPINDLTPLQGMKLESLLLSQSLVKDISPIEGMPITLLYLFSTRVSELRPIAGLPLEEFRLGNSPVADLRVLEGLPLTMLELTSIPATDFSPLAALKLTDLRLSNTKFADLTLVRGESLRVLYLDGCRNLRDLTPLKEFKSLETLTLPVQAKNIDFLRQMPSLKRIGFSEATLQPADEFWKTFDARRR